jgi:hypothetical protein
MGIRMTRSEELADVQAMMLDLCPGEGGYERRQIITNYRDPEPVIRNFPEADFWAVSIFYLHS